MIENVTYICIELSNEKIPEWQSLEDVQINMYYMHLVGFYLGVGEAT